MGPARSKRRRTAADTGSRSPHSHALVSDVSDFTNNIKAQVRAMYGSECWHCGGTHVHICHVIGSRDDTFHVAVADGLIDFHHKNTTQNAINLCPSCHVSFDDHYNPSFFFLPTDLKYFLAYEQQDRKRRREVGRVTGKIPRRTCPTAQKYQEHQMRYGVEGAASGGLYTRIVLSDFTSKYPGRPPFQPGPSEYGATKSWKGSPMAALHRAIVVLKRLNLQGIPMEIRDGLQQLQDAYSKDFDIDGSDTGSQGNRDFGEAIEIDFAEGSGEQHEEERRGPGTKPQQSRAEQGSASRSEQQHDDEQLFDNDEERTGSSEDDGSWAPYLSRTPSPMSRDYDFKSVKDSGYNSSAYWCWGPETTAQQVAAFFQSVAKL